MIAACKLGLALIEQFARPVSRPDNLEYGFKAVAQAPDVVVATSTLHLLQLCQHPAHVFGMNKHHWQPMRSCLWLLVQQSDALAHVRHAGVNVCDL
jgi:hypothetical protein